MTNENRTLPSRRAAMKRLSLAFALGATLASIGATTAFAQSGGAVAPGDPAAPPATPAPAAGVASPYVFPIAGRHTYGQGFGAARVGYSHQGQDVMAACGTPLVAASNSRVVARKFQGAAGNYVVLKDTLSKQEYAYYHMASPAIVLKGQTLLAGQQVGVVGTTGRSSACHLHFELWTKKGYYRGGHPINPLLTLQAWDPTA